MAKKKKAEAEAAEANDGAAATAAIPAVGTDKPKAKRGRPAGAKSSKKVSQALVKAKGRRGRPKGSKNKAKSTVGIGKRSRGRPPGSGKKVNTTPSGLRGVIVNIVREEVHAALLQAFKGL